MFGLGITLLNKSVTTSSTPTTWNPANKTAGITLSGGNLTGQGTGASGGTAKSVAFKTTGTFYIEHILVTQVSGGVFFGVCNGATMTNTWSWMDSINTSTIAVRDDGAVLSNGNLVGTAFTTYASPGDVICIAVDVTGKFYARKNNEPWNGGSGDPVAGTGGYPFTPSGNIYAAIGIQNDTWTTRFNSSSWTYAAPSGYIALS